MPEPNFVARDSELKRLREYLEKALAGQTQICFVAGDAGAGKSSLLAELAHRAQVANEMLLIALGECNAQTGLGDPFLPFREILAQLTGDTEAKVTGGKITPQNAERLANFIRVSGHALVEVAPDIIGTLIPGSQLVAKAAKAGAERAGWLDKLEKKATAAPTKLDENMIFQQVLNLLVALAKEQPLLLILDDLQWADQASISLLFFLSRALKDARILIVGAYRPSDVALGRDGARHPLETSLNEIKRYRGDVLIDLNETSEADRRAFLEAFIDSEPNHLGADFREALFAHTGGYPLFTVELLRSMQERSDLVWDETALCWMQSGMIDWENLPARVEGVIEERIGRLAENLRDILTTASVEGMQFTTFVIARVLEITERDLLKNLSDELERRHRLVQEGGESKLGKVRLWHYRFSHVLFQRYLYDDLSQGERRLLHGDVARVLEALYAGLADTIAVQLAHHYEEAGEDEKASHYYQRAGEQAAAVYGNTEAIRHFTRALELGPQDDAIVYELYRTREQVYDLLGDRVPQLLDIEALERLSEVLSDDRRRAQAALRRANYSLGFADYPAAISAAEKAVDWAQALGDNELEVQGHLRMGETYWRWNDFGQARVQFEQSLELSRKLGEQRLEADSLLGLGMINIYPVNAVLSQSYFEQALDIVRDLGDRVREANVLGGLGLNAVGMNDYAATRSYLEDALHIARKIGYRQNQVFCLGNLAAAATFSGDYIRAQAYFEDALQLAHDMQDRFNESWGMVGISNVHKNLGDYSVARGYLLEALRTMREIGEQGKTTIWESLCLFGLANLDAKLGNFDEARISLDEVLKISRLVADPLREGWATSLAARLYHYDGHNETAYDTAKNALAIAETIDHRDLQQFTLDILGQVLVALRQLDEAAHCYQRALALQRELKQPHNASEALSGLARVSLAQGNVPGALAHIEEVLTFDQAIILAADEPGQVYLTCYHVLKAAHDLRSEQILRTGYELLQTLATKMSDESMRRSFLENVPYNRDLLAVWKARAG